MTIKILHNDIDYCLGIVQNVQECYALNVLPGGDSPTCSIDYLIEIAPNLTSSRLDIFESEVPYDSGSGEHAVMGYFIARADCCEVVILAGLNFCWQRFVLCKELFHVFLHKDEFYPIDLASHIEQIYDAFDATGEAVGPKPLITSEKLAEIAAIEFLFPYDDRVACVASGMTSATIAALYKIPLVIVEKYLTEPNMIAIGRAIERRKQAQAA